LRHSIIENRSGTGSCGRQSTQSSMGAGNRIRHVLCKKRKGFGPDNGSDSDVTPPFCRAAKCSTSGASIEPAKHLSKKELTMKLFVVGATGRTGQEIVQQALERGHHVTAFVRSLEAVNLKRERLTVLQWN